MNYADLKKYIDSNEIDDLLKSIILKSDIDKEKRRYHKLLDDAYERFGDGDFHFISSPGRSEIGGNHTDHQHGHVLAASLSIDNLVCVKANSSTTVRYFDPLFSESIVDLSCLKVLEEEKNTSNSLIRGIAAKLKELGYIIGGFDAVSDSLVLGGSGISSSACFEVMIVEIFSSLFNQNSIDPVKRAVISQFAENVYFGKPCGLLDQLAISVGGFVAADFKNPDNPVIENFKFSFEDYGYSLVLVNTKGDHSDLSTEYAAIPNEIKEVSKELGVEYLADSTYESFIDNLAEIRKNVKNDRALIRSIHFFNEDKRAIEEKEAVRNKDIDKLLKLMNESGRSSFMYLQNTYPIFNYKAQNIPLALGITENFLCGKGAFRIHGGGFEGTIQAIVPVEMLKEYKDLMTSVYGLDAVLEVAIRPFGTKTVI